MNAPSRSERPDHPGPTSAGRVAEHAADAVQHAATQAADAAGAVACAVTDAAREAALAVKPRLRGWIHAGTAPLALTACLILTVLAEGPALTWACLVYLLASLLLFANSGVYHISNGHFPTTVTTALQRFDHANIYLLIAGTYTPLSVALLPAPTAALVLGVVWVGAALGILTCLAWPTAPRWLATLLYVALGWVAVWFMPAFWASGGPAIVWLLIGGGVAYTVGGAVYAARFPDPAPRWFGFHEVFHVCTVLAWTCHCLACYLAVL